MINIHDSCQICVSLIDSRSYVIKLWSRIEVSLLNNWVAVLPQNLSRLKTFPTWPWSCPELLLLNIVYSHVIWHMESWVVHRGVILSRHRLTRFIIPPAPRHRLSNFSWLKVRLFPKELLLLSLLLPQLTVVDTAFFRNCFFFALSVIFERWLLYFLTLFIL